MQKVQHFSCLFRHYAKHNGLRKEDLVFSFVDELIPDQQPETVHLMPDDRIYVEHRKVVKAEESARLDPMQFQEQFRSLLTASSDNHSDITFSVGDDGQAIRAHKAILSARSEYFRAMFKRGMAEHSKDVVKVKDYDRVTFGRMLEYLYTNSINDLNECSSNDIINLLMMANEYVLDDLRMLCEISAKRVLNSENICKFLLLSSKHNADRLRDACTKFVIENKKALAQDSSFRAEVEESPELGLLLFEINATAEDNDGPSPSHGRKRKYCDTLLNEVDIALLNEVDSNAL